MLHFKKKYFIYFLDRRDRREKERERNISVWLPLTRPPRGTQPAAQACALTGNRTSDHLFLNPLSRTSQGCCTFEMHLFFSFLNK